MRAIAVAVLEVLGAAAIDYGVWLAWRPGAFLVAGAFLLAGGFLLGGEAEK